MELAFKVAVKDHLHHGAGPEDLVPSACKLHNNFWLHVLRQQQ